MRAQRDTLAPDARDLARAAAQCPPTVTRGRGASIAINVPAREADRARIIVA